MITKTDSNRRFLYPVADIKVGTRMRTDFGDVQSLADSIRDNGLIHPPCINTHGDLIAGERRLRAMRDILKWIEIPVTFLEFADEATLRILEREENVRRKQMTWQEEVMSIADVHRHYQMNEALKSRRWTNKATGEFLGMSEASVSYTLQLADLIRKGDKEINACKFYTDAIHLLVKRRAEESIKIVAKLTLPKTDLSDVNANSALNIDLDGEASNIFSSVSGPSSGSIASPSDDGEMPAAPSTASYQIPLSRMVLHGNAVSILSSMEPASVDHVITDWPYGIDMDNIQQAGGGMDVSSTAAEHGVDANEALHASIVPLIYRVLRPNGFFITWTDYMQWQRNYDLCIAAGFKVQRWPLIWYKTSRCQNMAANYNFTKNHELAIVCRKENATLLSPQATSVWPGSNEAEERLLGHPFAKPFKLWEWIYGAVVQRGQSVLDPFAGRGSATIAALQYGASPIAIEVNEHHHAALVVNVADYYRKALGNNVSFV